MAWGIDFKADIFLSGQNFLSKQDVQDNIDDIDKSINDCEAILKMYATANPRDIVPSDYSEEPISWLNNRINEELEDYQEYLSDRYNLRLYLKYLDDGGKIDIEE